MIYRIRQITDRFSTPIDNPKTYDRVFLHKLKVGSIIWTNDLTDDNLSGEYEVLERIDK